MSRSRYGYSPALDGVRGVAMVTFMAFHFGISGVPGAWIAVNIFFVLSGFLIVRLLIEELHRDGRIDALAFYRRRIRRLIPALLVLLAAIVVHGMLFTAAGQRRELGWDVLATLGYVMNWRLIATEDAYFDTFADPSPLRHAWTLSIEEQFYLVVPFLLLALFALVRRRWARAGFLLLLAVGSAVWTAVLGLDDPATDHSRLYYGTDVRAQSLIVGAALGTLLAVTPTGRRYHLLEARPTHLLGWVALVATAAGVVLIDPYDGWMFNAGGMLLVSVVAAVLVMACQDPDPSALTRMLGWRPVAHVGRLSYALYLWHWPVYLWLGPERIAGSVLLTALVGMAITFGIAQLSWTYVEQPVIRRGIRGLLPGVRGRQRLVAAVVPVALVAVGGLGLTRAAPTGGEVAGEEPPPFDPAGLDVEAGPVQPLLEGQADHADAPSRIGVFGDSVPHLLVQDFPREEYPDISLTDATVPGCDFFNLPVRWSEDTVEEPEAECRDLHRNFDSLLEEDRAEVLVVFASPLTLAPHVAEDGSIMQADDPEYRDHMIERLDTVARRAKAAGVQQVQVVNVPCRELPEELPGGVQWQIFDRQPELRDEWEDPTRINDVVEEWVEGTEGAALIDLDEALCSDGFQREVNGEPLYGDIVHFSPRSAPMLWTWLTGRVSSNWEER